MPDREKVIERLEEMEQWLMNKSYSDLRARDHYEIVGAAIDLLKAKEPIAPKAMDTAIPAGKTAVRIIKTYWCGECGEAVTKFGNNFCPKCGRKVLWDGDT